MPPSLTLSGLGAPIWKMARTKRGDKMLRDMGDRLRACRVAAGFKEAEDLAPLLGIEGPRLRKYERGERMPPIEVLEQLSNLLDKTLDFLILGRPNISKRS